MRNSDLLLVFHAFHRFWLGLRTLVAVRSSKLCKKVLKIFQCLPVFVVERRLRDSLFLVRTFAPGRSTLIYLLLLQPYAVLCLVAVQVLIIHQVEWNKYETKR